MDPNERLTGIAGLPQGGPQPPMGGPPMGGPPMGGPAMGGPTMGGPAMGGPSMPEPGMGEMAMQGEPPMEEASMNIEQDAMMLAEAVVGRAKGDIPAAVAVLDNANAMLMSAAEGGGQEPQMAMNGGPMYANMGGPLDYNMGGPMYQDMGGPMYAEGGRSLSDADMLRQMIMESLQGKSDRSMSDSDMAMLMQMMSGSGNKSMSDSDMAGSPLMRGGGGELNPGLQALQEPNPEVVNKILKRDMGGSIKDSMILSDAEKFSKLLKGMR